MPTPTGLPKKGELIRHKETGQVWRIVERTTNDKNYSLKIAPHSHGACFIDCVAQARGYKYMLEAAYWLRPNTGPWELLP